jgi:hypothetical protein
LDLIGEFEGKFERLAHLEVTPAKIVEGKECARVITSKPETCGGNMGGYFVLPVFILSCRSIGRSKREGGGIAIRLPNAVSGSPAAASLYPEPALDQSSVSILTVYAVNGAQTGIPGQQLSEPVSTLSLAVYLTETVPLGCLPPAHSHPRPMIPASSINGVASSQS